MSSMLSIIISQWPESLKRSPPIAEINYDEGLRYLLETLNNLSSYQEPRQQQTGKSQQK